MRKNLFAVVMMIGIMLFSGCSTKVYTTSPMPQPAEKGVKKKVALFSLHNYTDTPDAGKRAANIVEGVLLAKGYEVASHISEGEVSQSKAIAEAASEGDDYVLLGGVSEWRYKTGIDGEPAVSLHMKLIDPKTGKVVWSATASGNDWGNASIGTTAQQMIEEMVAK
ncbi:DUF4136 domain-containing protein [Hydrogenimonas sp. SS33]|uniref:DUF4136 domain-containing protein n=1 Tax=Hydrogenimonas leucolamina TaxID=2954236 RepID=UPI00336BE864